MTNDRIGEIESRWAQATMPEHDDLRYLVSEVRRLEGERATHNWNAPQLANALDKIARLEAELREAKAECSRQRQTLAQAVGAVGFGDLPGAQGVMREVQMQSIERQRDAALAELKKSEVVRNETFERLTHATALKSEALAREKALRESLERMFERAIEMLSSIECDELLVRPHGNLADMRVELTNMLEQALKAGVGG
jgi:chromosome segregation ATPase